MDISPLELAMEVSIRESRSAVVVKLVYVVLSKPRNCGVAVMAVQVCYLLVLPAEPNAIADNVLNIILL